MPERCSLIARYLLQIAGAATLVACTAEPGLAARSEIEAGGSAREQSDDGDTSSSGLATAPAASDAGAYADAEAPPASTPQDAAVDASDALAPVDAATARSDVRTSLIVPSLWRPVGPFEDPFDDGPEFPHCPAAALMAEILGDEPVFSVNTGDCDYVTVSQSTQRAVAAGETLKVRLWHFELNAAEPATAHAAVLVDGFPVLDERVPIPQPGGLISRALRLTRAVPAGALVHFHLHNHGANSWSLVELSAGP